MASQESGGSSSGHLAESQPPRRSRFIHFPIDDANAPGPSRHIHRPIDATAKPLSLSVKTSLARRTSPLNPQNLSYPQRRIRSLGASGDTFQEIPNQRGPFTFTTPSRHVGRGYEPLENDNIERNLFSDEYDLYPKILQDVQRALKLKARREARLSHQTTPPRPDLLVSRPLRTTSLAPSHVIRPSSPVSPSGRKASISSDIDFSPSTGTAFSHPVPTSLDNGLTLDWSGFDDKPESKWKLTTVKRKGKETQPQSAIAREQQETAYADKLGRLRSLSSLQTLKKAKMTEDQLGRRYNTIYHSITIGESPNTAKAVRWYRQQNAKAQDAMEKAEPFTWLKHLEKQGAKSPESAPWHISALIVEEYLRDMSRHESMPTVSEDSPLRQDSYGSPSSSLFVDSQLAPVKSRASSNQFLGPSLVRKLSFEDKESAAVHVYPARASLEVDALQSRESSFSSLPLGISSVSPISPSNPDVRKPQGPSGPMPTSSDNINDQGFLSVHSGYYGRKHELSPTRSPDMNINVISASDGSDNEISRRTGFPLHPAVPTTSDAEAPDSRATRLSERSRQLFTGRRHIHASLPSANKVRKSTELQQQREADEQKAYETKLRLLEQATATNHRIRQLLNRVSGGIREYDAMQSNSMISWGIGHIGLPREVIDAFGHDPAAVTGRTRRFQGWRAVDDIQHRLARQREVFRAFLSRAQNQLPQTKSVLDDPISSLMESLKALELHSQRIAGRAFEVGEALKTVQAKHDEVKVEYNKTLARTAVVYPELSKIVVLEERYKDQYQQFWEFGMDTLTFILDTVTPFWRTYGKTIGEDVQDFLIIPLYRNEFTGEPKRYPITRVPYRSPRHWLGLVVFFLMTVGVAIIQLRAALSSSALYNLPMIPYESIRWTALPFFWLSIVIQWWAVAVETVIVFLQLAVVVWWIGWSVRLLA
ncbi:hypothetical protein H0H93_014207 [Arthromyces matolae]|nr:hypothetical protein H0H93_014207 [Arthromyces matolae]